jgi:hypothetical protein
MLREALSVSPHPGQRIAAVVLDRQQADHDALREALSSLPHQSQHTAAVVLDRQQADLDALREAVSSLPHPGQRTATVAVAVDQGRLHSPNLAQPAGGLLLRASLARTARHRSSSARS